MAKEKTNALATINNFNLPVLSEDIGQAMAEEMEGLTLNFPRVKIPSGGGLAFEVPGDDPENPDTVKEIVGVMVDHHPVNAFWADKYTGGNSAPDCSSMDGKVGIDQEGNRRACNSCPWNAWGTAEDGRGKACKNMHRVYILQEGETLPLLLTIPPTSIKNLSDYMGLRIVSKGLRSYGVITKITLKKAQNAGGINYSQAVFTLAGKLDPEQVGSIADYSKGIKVLTRQLDLVDEDYLTRPSCQDEDEDEDEDGLGEEVGADEIPF